MTLEQLHKAYDELSEEEKASFQQSLSAEDKQPDPNGEADPQAETDAEAEAEAGAKETSTKTAPREDNPQAEAQPVETASEEPPKPQVQPVAEDSSLKLILSEIAEIKSEIESMKREAKPVDNGTVDKLKELENRFSN